MDMDVTREQLDSVRLFLMERIAEALNETEGPYVDPMLGALESAVMSASAAVEGLLDLPEGASAGQRTFAVGEAAAGWDVLVAASTSWTGHPVYPLAARRTSTELLLSV